MGATGKSGQTYIIPIVLNSMLGTKFRVVTGYQGINLIHLAMERGELHGSAASWPTIAAAKKSWVEKGLIANLITIAMEREPDLPDVPALSEVVTSAEDRALIPLLAGLGRARPRLGRLRRHPAAIASRRCARPGPRPWPTPRSAPMRQRAAWRSIRCPGRSSRAGRKFWHAGRDGRGSRGYWDSLLSLRSKVPMPAP